MTMGSNPVDGKHLIFSTEEYKNIIVEFPLSKKYTEGLMRSFQELTAGVCG
jgi:hypothetical protein